MKVLFVLTSHSELGDTGKKTGFWVEEFAEPYLVRVEAGVDVTVEFQKGGQQPLTLKVRRQMPKPSQQSVIMQMSN